MSGKIKIYNSINEFEKLKTKEELLEKLKKYRTILNSPMYDYLNEAIYLEISILKDYISYDTRCALSELEIYNDIAKYNIYHRTTNLFLDSSNNLIEDENGMLTIYNSELKYNIFRFIYAENLNLKSTFDTKKSNNVGYITIYNLLEKNRLSNDDINALKEKLIKVENKLNPYGSYIYRNSTQRLAYDWEMDKKQEITEYKKYIRSIEENEELSNDKLKKIETINNYFLCLNDEFGLKQNEFEQTVFDVDNESYTSKVVKSMDKLVLKKVITKRDPNLVINIETKYI